MSAVVPKVSVVIVNWNGLVHLQECLQSLQVQTFTDFEIVLVDNGSTDESISFVSRNFPKVKLVGLSENTGFAGGNNIGYEHSSGDYIVALNNDTAVDSRWLQELVRVADENPAVGMVGSRICAYDDHDRIDSLGILICVDGMSRGAYRNQSFSEQALSGNLDILLPSACAALYKRTMIEQIGFFDDDFFAYCEDTDLGLRGRRYGWGAMLAIKAIVYHKYSQSGGEFSPFKLYHVERNHFWTLIKNFPVSSVLLSPLWTIWRYLLQAKLVASSKGSGSEFRASATIVDLIKALLKGIVDAVVGFGRNWGKRQIETVGSRISDKEFLALMKKYHLRFQELLDDAG